MSAYIYSSKRELNKAQREKVAYLLPDYENMYELTATSQKSYYGKAQVIECDCGRYLMSYTTIVCYISNDGDFYRLWDGYSATTMKHINDFILLCGHSEGGKKYWDSLEVKSMH